MSKGLGVAQVFVLKKADAARRDGGTYQSLVYQWGKAANLHKVSISRAIKSLEGKGFISRQGSGRYVRILITDYGRIALLDRCGIFG